MSSHSPFQDTGPNPSRSGTTSPTALPRSGAIAPRVFPNGLLWAACGLAALVIVWIGWSGYGLQRVLGQMEEYHPRIMRARGKILQMDALLTMFANMAAVTGDVKWEEQYRRLEPELDDAIVEAERLGAAGGFTGSAAAQIRAANAKLVDMEHEAFNRVHEGRLGEAQAILFSEAYGSQKRIYDQGMTALTDQLSDAVHMQIVHHRKRLLLDIVISSMLMVVLLIASFRVLRAVVLWQASLREQSRQLTIQAHELALTNATLDQRVAERTSQLEIAQRAVEQSGNLVFITDTGGRIQYVNPKFTQVTGYTPAEAIGKTPRILKSGERDQADYQHMWNTIRAGEEWHGEFRNKTKGGELFWVSAAISPIRNANGTVTHFVAIQEDITQRKRADQALKASEERFRELAENIEEVFFVVDPEVSTMSYISPAYERVWGRTCDSLYQAPQSFVEGVHPEDRPGVIEEMGRLKLGQMFDREYRVVHPNGSVHWVRARTFPIRDAQGRMVRVAGIAENITAQKRGQEALRESEARFRQLAENIHQVFWLSDPGTTQILYVSPAYETIWGRPVQSLYDAPRSLADTVHPEDRPGFDKILEQQDIEGSYDHEYRIVRPDGSVRWIRDRAFPIRDESGMLLRVAGIAEDITDRKRVEEELRAAEAGLIETKKMESIGRLAAGIAHDFNNYLSVIHGFAELIQLRSKSDAKLSNQIREVLHAAESGTELVKQLMAFSRQRATDTGVLSLTAAMTRAEPLLRQLVGQGVRVAVEAPDTSLMVRMDPTALEQILMNLASNARDAMKKSGALTLRAGRVMVDEPFRAAHAWAAERQYVRLSVTDTGPGMEPAVAEQIFEPFFTTKKLGQGSGLGLAVVHGLVRQHGGAIEVDTAPGRGTTFNLYFPHAIAADAVPAEVDAAPGAAAPVTGQAGRRVLVVDDEAGNRMLCREILQGSYTVLTASSGKEALEMLRSGSADVLLTDMRMPEMDGVALIEQALKLCPGLKVAVMSGYMTDERNIQLRSLPGRCEIVRKPLTVDAVKGAVGRCLAA